MYAELELKVCPKCGETKPTGEFHASYTKGSGKASWCKDCHNKWRRAHRAKHKERYQDYEFKRALRRYYGLTVDQYNKMLTDQNGCCACCGKDGSLFKNRLHVDHDHASGQVRALLCTECNPGLGYFKHSIERLEMAIRYLEKFKK